MKSVSALLIASALVTGAASIAGYSSSAFAQSSLPSCSGAFSTRWDNCQGTYTFSDGEKYVGEFRRGQYSGQGSWSSPNGQKHVGQYRDGKRNGYGTYTFPDGGRYVGEFREGKFSGQGTFSFADGTQHTGEYRDDKRNGQGTYTLPSGEKYVGNYRDDKPNGLGTYSFRSGAKYVGEFRDGHYNGQATYTFPDGGKYIGEYRDDKRNGQGILYSAAGQITKNGFWNDDAFVGENPQNRAAANQPQPAASGQQAGLQEPSKIVADPPVATKGKRVALVIGNAAYRNAPALVNPVKDANTIASTLRAVGFQNVTLRSDLSREGLIQALRDFAVTADDAEWAMIYYAGHGIEFGGVNYMIPIDAQLKADRDIDLEAVNIGQVLNAIEGAKRLRLVILDACRDNPFANQMRRTQASRSMGRGLARLEPEAGTLVVYSAKHGEVALDGTGANSPFADALAKRIQQNPPVEIRRLFDFVRDDVLDSTSRKQQPFSYGSLSASADFYFNR